MMKSIIYIFLPYFLMSILAMTEWSELLPKEFLVMGSSPLHGSIVWLTYYLILQAGKHLPKSVGIDHKLLLTW